jgi:hypothetical protein
MPQAGDWIDIVSALSGIATIGTLIFVVIKEYKTRKDVTDLAVLSKQLITQNQLQKMQMKAQVKPILQILGYENSQYQFLIKVKNIGEYLEIKQVSCADQSLEVDRHENVQLSKNEAMSIVIRSKRGQSAPDWKEKDLRFFVWYKDIYSNHYYAALVFNEGKPYVSVTDVVSPLERNLDNFMNEQLQKTR